MSETMRVVIGSDLGMAIEHDASAPNLAVGPAAC